MFVTCCIIVGLCVLFHHVILDKVISGDRLEFSGNGLWTSKEYWILITASLIHVTLSHEINNLLFTFVVVYVAETQFLLSPIWIIIVFIITGIGGWMASIYHQLYKHPMLGMFIPSRGISPNMYGFMFFLCITYPNNTFSNIINIHPIIWILLIIILPTYLSQNPKHKPFIWNRLCLFVCIIFGFIYYTTNWFNNITSGYFMSLYLIKCFISWGYHVQILGLPSSSDHACHFGGGVSGIILGIIYQYLYLNNTLYDGIYAAMTKGFVIAFSGLIFRITFNV